MAILDWSTNNCTASVCTRYDLGGHCVESVSAPTLKGLECVFNNVLTVIAEIALLVVFIMLVVGGFKYMTAGGDPKATDSAKNTITYAIFGLIGLIFVWLFLKLISVITGVDLTTFKIGLF